MMSLSRSSRGPSSFTSTHSQLPRVLLQLNPGLHRQLDSQLKLMDSLGGRAVAATVNKRHKFHQDLLRARDMRRRIFRRKMKMDEETRKDIDRIREEHQNALQRRQELQQEQQQLQGKPKSRRRGDRSRSGDSDDEDAALRPWTPTSAVGSAADQWGSQPPSVTGSEMGVEKSGVTGSGYPQGSSMSSRRSSLKSTSVLELEGMGRPDSPGPNYTEDPLEAIGGANKPEVVVTQVAHKGKPESPPPGAQAGDDENKLQLPETGAKIWNLLPAPTPTRFVGRMHAVVSGEKRFPSASENFSRKSSIVSDTIQEDATKEANKEDSGSSPEDNRATSSPPGRPFSAKKYTMFDAAGVTCSTRFVGRMHRAGKSLSGSGEGSRSSSAAGKRHSWRTAMQSSTKSEAGTVSHGTSLKRMASLGSSPPQNAAKGAAWKGIVSRMGSASSVKGKKKTEIKKIGRRKVRFIRRDSSDILAQFGKRPVRVSQDPLDKASSGDPVELILPGMKRALYMEDDTLTEDDRDSSISLIMNTDVSETAPDAKAAASGGLSSVASSVFSTNVNKSDIISTFAKGMPTTSKLVGKLHSLRAAQKQQDGSGISGLTTANGQADPDDKWDWMTGVPTSIRFVARSWRNIPRGPGGIVTDTPEARLEKVEKADFSGTINMLTLLAKADLKLKSQVRDDDDSYAGSDPNLGPGRKMSTSAFFKQALPANINAKEQENQTDTSEKETALAKLVEGLVLVDPPSIARWNLDKNIHEETGGEPFFLKCPQKVIVRADEQPLQETS